MKKCFFAERAVVQAAQDSVSAPRGIQPACFDVFEEDPLVEAAALVPGPASGNSRRRVLTVTHSTAVTQRTEGATMPRRCRSVAAGLPAVPRCRPAGRAGGRARVVRGRARGYHPQVRAPSSPTATSTSTGATTWPAQTSGSTPEQNKASTHSVPNPHSKRAAPKSNAIAPPACAEGP